MPNSDATESEQSLPLHRVLEDEYMNLYGPLPDGYPWSFLGADIKDPLALTKYLQRGGGGLAAALQEQLPETVKAPPSDVLELLEGRLSAAPKQAKKVLRKLRAFQSVLANVLNTKLEDESLRDFFEPFKVEEAKRIAARYLPHNNCSLVNRLLLEMAFPDWLKNKRRQDDLEASEEEETDQENNEEARDQWVKEQSLSTIYGLIHEQQRSALCLSGGGIRSATFNLGILQGFARKRLIGKFDYLSTVSGGGYVGSWLSAWIHRHQRGVEGVMDELSGKPVSELVPDPPEISHLRTYSNYLSPQTGLLSADTWTLAATVLRNLFLNWLVFIPLLLAVLMIPRIYVAAMRRWTNDLWEPWSLVIGFVLALIGVSYVGLYLPSKDDRKSNQNRFLWQCLSPLVLSAMWVTFFWARYNDGSRWAGWKNYLGIESDRSLMIGFMVLATVLILIGWIFFVYSRRDMIARYIDDSSRLYDKNVIGRVIFGLFFSVVVIVLAGCVSGYLIWKVSSYFQQSFIFDHTRTYACFAVPLLMLFLMLAATLLLGLTSRGNTDEEQEWFARLSGWILIVIVCWIVVSGLVLSVTDMSDNLLDRFVISSWWKNIGAIIGVLSGFITIVGGFSAETPAHLQRDDKTPRQKGSKRGFGAVVRKTLPALAAPIFFVFLIIVFSLLTNWLLVNFSPRLGSVLQKIGVEYNQVDFGQPPVVQEGGQLFHRDIVRFSGLRLLLTTTALLALFGWVMGLLIDTGKFSIHSMYANRLKRAYLGASRKDRRANWFTNFDSADDLPMHMLRPAIFSRKSFSDLPGLIALLNGGRDQLTKDVRDKLSGTTKNLMQAYKPTAEPSEELVRVLSQDLNKLLDGDCIYVEERHPEPTEPMTLKMLNQNLQGGLKGESRVLLNRLYLEEAYPGKIKKVADELNGKPLSKPLHVVNIALNLMRGDRLAWQERKAETFTVSPLHSGNHILGYRRSRYYGGERGISLGTAFTISGAAASPNMGYMISSPLVSFLMAMFNVRLGWWLGNPTSPEGDRTFGRSAPLFTLGPIVEEALSMADDKSPYVYLSDGGHFENLGLYEMVLRRCHLIVVSDASTDPEYKFDSLGMALRKIRIDLGVPIEFDGFQIHSGFANSDSRYVAIGKIRYSCVDDENCPEDGTLIYIKASLTGKDEPRDVLHYQLENETFPQEFIGDQWFSESQFESYRVLGSHIVDAICLSKDKEDLNLEEFENRVQEHVNPLAAAAVVANVANIAADVARPDKDGPDQKPPAP